MQRNMGTADRSIRVVAGLIICSLGLYFNSWWGLIGLMPLGTSLTGWCPPYSLLGINTCASTKEQPAESTIGKDSGQ